MDKTKITDFMRKIYYFPHKVPVAQSAEEVNQEQVELLPEERRSRFRRFLTEKVSAGWHIEIENEFDAVISRKIQTGWFGKFLIFVLLLLIFLPLAVFYLIYVIVKGVQGKQKLLRVWIDIYGNIKTS